MCNRAFRNVCSFCGLYISDLNRSPTPHVCKNCYVELYDPSLPFEGKDAVNLAKKWYERVKGLETMHEQDRITISRLRKENWKLKRKIAKFEKKE